MATTQASATHDHHQSPIATQQVPQGQMHGRRQPEHVSESSPPLHRYLGNSYVQAMTTTGGETLRAVAIPPMVQEVLRSPGQPLDPTTCTFMESRFDADFSQVRVHTDPRAAESAQAVNALAYTVGHNVVFGANKYAPSSHNRRRLLAHELAHTIQQRKASGAPPSADPHGIVESSADAAGREIANGRSVSGDLPACGVGLSRAPAPPAESAFSADRRMRTWRRYAGSEAQKDAARIRKSGKLSSEHRQEINAKLAFFEGEAKDVYIREITPALSVAEQAERREKEANLAYYTSTRQSVLDRQAAEQAKQREREGIAAYYTSTRQSVLDRQAAERAKLREEVYNLPLDQIRTQWEARKEAFIDVASSPANRLRARQLYEIWRWYWDERVAAGNLKMKEIRKRETQIDRAEFMKKLWRFEEGREYDALGPEYREAAANVAAGTLMFRTAVEASEFCRIYEQRGKTYTLQALNKDVLEYGRHRQQLVSQLELVLTLGRSALISSSLLPTTLRPTISPRKIASPSESSRPAAGATPAPLADPAAPRTVVASAPVTPTPPTVSVRPPTAAPVTPIPPAVSVRPPTAPSVAPAATPPAATRSVVVPAPVKPPPPAAPVRQSPASPLSRWDRLKMRLGSKYLEAVMESKLSNVVPTKIAGGSLPGQTPAVIAKTKPSPAAPTPDLPPGTPAPPQAVSPAKTGTPSALSRPPTTEGAVKTLAPAPKQVGKTPQAPPVSVVLPRAYTPRAANQNALPGKTPQQHVVPLAATGTDGLVGPVKIIKSGKQGNASGLRIVASGERETPGRGTPVPGTVQVSGTTAPSPPQRPSPAPSPERNFDDESTAS